MNDDHDEVRHGPRTWVVLLGTLVAVALAVVGTLGVTRLLDDGDVEVAVATTTTVDDVIDVDPVDVAPTRIDKRETEAGLDVRMYFSEDLAQFGLPGNPGDGVPDHCKPIGSLSATVIADDTIAQSQVPATVGVPEGDNANAQMLWSNQVGGRPIIGVLMQVDSSITMARFSAPGLGVDSAEPVDGYVALAVLGPPPDDKPVDPNNPFGNGFPGGIDPIRYVIDLVDDAGDTVRVPGRALQNGPKMWNDQQCFDPNFEPGVEAPPPDTVPPPTLPKPSRLQPEDPDAAEREIRAAFKQVFAQRLNADGRDPLIDDPSGLIFAVANTRKGDVDKHFEKFVITMQDELVFLTDVEASFFYTVEDTVWESTNEYVYGRARLIDGVWKITRATFCQEISRAGLGCGP
jgi:hypothetical protein